jgi:hypothetical protein
MVKTSLSCRVKELSARALSLQRAVEVEASKRAELSLLETALATAVKERSGWLNVLRTSADHAKGPALDHLTGKDAEIAALVANLGSLGPEALNAAPSNNDGDEGNNTWTDGVPSVEYLRSKIQAHHLDDARDASWMEINSRVRLSAIRAAQLLDEIEGLDPQQAADTERELVSTITESYAFSIAAHIVQPSQMWKANATRMDTNELSGVPESVARLAITRTKLTTKQKRTIAAGYALYMKSLPYNERTRLLTQLSEPRAFHPFVLSPENPPSLCLAAVATGLENMLQKWQQSGLTLATLVGNVLTLQQICCAVVAFYPYWYSASDCEYWRLAFCFSYRLFLLGDFLCSRHARICSYVDITQALLRLSWHVLCKDLGMPMLLRQTCES